MKFIVSSLWNKATISWFIALFILQNAELMCLSVRLCKSLLCLLVSLIFTQNSLSCDPVVISGPTTICPGSTNVYTVSGISASQINFWSIGAQPGQTATICGFVNVTPLSVSLCVAEGFPTLCVLYDNGCEACINITVLDDPFEDFDGALQVCGGDTEIYTLSPSVPNNLVVNYSAINGSVISSSNSQVEVQWATNQTSGQICASVSSCNNNYSICRTVVITPIPIGNPVTLSFCENGSTGQSNFNLTNSENTIGNGLPVTWFEDINLLIPIIDPSNYVSSSATIYAQLTQNGCLSEPIPVTLIITSIDPENYSMNIQEDQLCPYVDNQLMPITVNFLLPSSGLLTYEYELICANGTTTSSITTANGALNFNVNSSCTLNILSITSVASGCQVNFSPPLTDNFTYTIPPQIDVLPGFTNLCLGQTINLENFITVSAGLISWYSSNPPSSSGLLSSGIITPTVSNVYSAGVENDGCVYNISFPVNVIPYTPPNNISLAICENVGNINLNQYVQPPTLQGVWSGPGVNGNIFNPTGLSGLTNIIFNPNNPCYENSIVSFMIDTLKAPVLGNAQICVSSLPYDLTNLIDTFFISGVWSGLGVKNDTFTTTASSGIFPITFTSSDFCTIPMSTTIEVLPTIIPKLSSLDICETVPTVNLVALQDTNYSDGMWSGQNVSGNIFLNSGLIGINTLTFKSNDLCSVPVSTILTVLGQQTPKLKTLVICESSIPVDLISLVDTNFVSGIWSGSGVEDNKFFPDSLIGTNVISFISDSECTLPSFTTITVNGVPEISNIEVNCQADSNYYVVTFDITGGDSTSYNVNGILTSANYISLPIFSSIPFNVLVSDANKCPGSSLEFNKKCDCISSSGTMDFSNSPIRACLKDSVRVNFNNNSISDIDDKLLFVLHDNSSDNLGNILAISNKPTFAFPQNGIAGKTYYISSMIGNQLSNGGIDVNDPCFSISKGVPVIFYKPSISLPSMVDLCASACVDLPLSFIGEAPFSFSYELENSDGSIIEETIESIVQNDIITYCPKDLDLGPTQIAYFRVISVSDKNCELDTFPSIEIKIKADRTIFINEQLCSGEFLVFNGQMYDQFRPKGKEILPSENSNKCDSIIFINLSFLDPKINEINSLICRNDSILINNVKYDFAKPKGREVIRNGAKNGCDSIIIVNLLFKPDINDVISASICKEDSIVFNGITFNKFKTESFFTIPGGAENGCDSIITFKISFYETIIDTINLILNKGESILINGIKFSESNSNGLVQSSKLSSNGCIKYEYIIINFKQELISANITISDESCPDIGDGTIIINSISGCKNYNIKINSKTFQNITLPFSIEKLAPGFYFLEISGEVSCYFSTSLEIKASQSKGFIIEKNIFNLNLDIDSTLTMQITPTPASITWSPNIFLSCNDCLSPTVSDIKEDTRFIFELKDDFGCIFENDILVKVLQSDQKIIFPNIFSPNEDGNNDEFVVVNTKSQTIESLLIYDRWGTLVFSDRAKGKDQNGIVWDGRLNQQRVAQGVYVFICTIVSNNGKRNTSSGNILVID